MNAPLCWPRLEPVMHNDQSTLETALSWMCLGIVALMFILAPLVLLVPIPVVRIAVGVILALVGLVAWACAWAVRSA